MDYCYKKPQPEDDPGKPDNNFNDWINQMNMNGFILVHNDGTEPTSQLRGEGLGRHCDGKRQQSTASVRG